MLWVLVLFLQLCQDDDVRLFCFLLPDIYSQVCICSLNSHMLVIRIPDDCSWILVFKRGCGQLWFTASRCVLHRRHAGRNAASKCRVQVSLQCFDLTYLMPVQLQDLLCGILQDHFVMLKKDSLVSIISNLLLYFFVHLYVTCSRVWSLQTQVSGGRRSSSTSSGRSSLRITKTSTWRCLSSPSSNIRSTRRRSPTSWCISNSKSAYYILLPKGDLYFCWSTGNYQNNHLKGLGIG